MKAVPMREKLKNRKCAICKVKGCIGATHLKAYCSIECQAKLGLKLLEQKRKQEDREFKAETRRRKKEVLTRTEWFDKLQDLVNQYVLHVRDKGKPCFTCGTTNPIIKYDAGHYRSRGANSQLRFELKNIHKQCSVNCNQYGSGMRAEYREAIIKEYGKDTLEWLDGPHPLLKDQFPHWTDIENEIKRYRKILRENDIKPTR